MMVYDVTLNNLFIWTGAAWESVPASGDAGADGSVQYNDNGVVSGAANLQYNKASGYTSLRSGSALRAYVADNSVYSTISDRGAAGGLTIDNLNADGISLRIASTDVLNVYAGTAQVTGSATITGDLTVRTNKLAVTSTGVGIGTNSPSYLLDVRGTDTTVGLIAGATKGIRFVASASTSSIVGVDNTGAASYQPLSIGGSALDFSLNGSTAMTLNATGLGVGVASPVTRLQANKAGQTPGGTSAPNGALVISDTSNTSICLELGSNSAGIPYIQSRHISSFGFYDLVLQPTSGNVGVGVTPSASKLQVAGNIGLPNSCTASGETSGVFSIDVANLLALTGGNWRQASILVVYSGIDGTAANPTILQTVVTLTGLSTWNAISKNDIVGTASVAISNDTTTGARVTVTVPVGNSGSVYAMLLGGAGAATRPSMTINA
jgi:hypothetical protein